jgi:hypothetical protein
MCRAPVYWSGFHKVREQWNEEAYEHKCAEVFGQALDECFEETQDFADTLPPQWRSRIFKDLIEDFIDLEKTYKFLRWHETDTDEMEQVFYYGDYYSDRKIGKYIWSDDPPKEWMTRYPAGRSSGLERCGSRRRAAQDEWYTLGVYFVL